MKVKLSIFAAVLVAAGLVAGCKTECATETVVGTESGASGAASDTSAHSGTEHHGKVKKAVTQDGEVLYIVEVVEQACPAGDECKTRQCWKSKDGKTFCADAVKACPKKGEGCPLKTHMKAKDGTVVCAQTDPKACEKAGKKHWCVKQVKKCQKNGSGKCPAKTHVKSKDGKTVSCAPEADAKVAKETASGKVPEMADGVENDEVFLVVAD